MVILGLIVLMVQSNASFLGGLDSERNFISVDNI